MLKEIAGTRAYNILKKRKMETVEDVCQLFPSKYYDFSFINPLNTSRLDKNYAFVCKLVSYELKKQSSIYIVRCTLHDIYTQNELCVSWFGTTEMYNVLKKDYHPGDTCFIGGKLKASNKKNLFFMSNPIIFKKYDGESDCHIYTAYEKIRGISESNFERIINECLEHATIPDKVPRELLHKYNLMSKDEAIREMHKPSSVEGVKKAKYRLNIDDLLYFALQHKLHLKLPYGDEKDKVVAGFVRDENENNKYICVSDELNIDYDTFIADSVEDAKKQVEGMLLDHWKEQIVYLEDCIDLLQNGKE